MTVKRTLREVCDFVINGSRVQDNRQSRVERALTAVLVSWMLRLK